MTPIGCRLRRPDNIPEDILRKGLEAAPAFVWHQEVCALRPRAGTRGWRSDGVGWMLVIYGVIAMAAAWLLIGKRGFWSAEVRGAPSCSTPRCRSPSWRRPGYQRDVAGSGRLDEVFQEELHALAVTWVEVGLTSCSTVCPPARRHAFRAENASPAPAPPAPIFGLANRTLGHDDWGAARSGSGSEQIR
jgi:hypothetical protein